MVAGANPMLLKQGIALGTAAVVARIREMDKPVSGREGVAQIAAISGGGRNDRPDDR